MRSVPALLVCQALLLSFCSMVYELILAQAMATVMGATILRYSVTIGLFLFALGMGALCSGRCSRFPTLELLIGIEILVALLGAAAPILAIAGAALADRVFPGTGGLLDVSHLQAQFWVCAIGVLTGFEIPLLLRLADEGGFGALRARIIGFDFFGTFAGAVVFPLVLYPRLGLLGAALATAALNIAAGLALLLLPGALPRWRLALGFAVLAAGVACGALFEEACRQWLTSVYFRLGQI